jgi:hypothetical protein
MSILGNPSKNITIFVQRGVDFETTFTMRNPDGSLVDLSTSSFLGQVRKTKTSPTVEAEFSFSVSGNEVTISLPTSETDSMIAGDNDIDEASKYVYDILWLNGEETLRPFEGALIFSETVTRV